MQWISINSVTDAVDWKMKQLSLPTPSNAETGIQISAVRCGLDESLRSAVLKVRCGLCVVCGPIAAVRSNTGYLRYFSRNGCTI